MSRQRNVQQQNELTFESMFKTAKYFREHGLSRGSEVFFAEENIKLGTSAIVFAQSVGYMMGFRFGFGGLIVTDQHRFYSFELEMNSTLSEVVFVHKFNEVTAEQNFSQNNKGTGKGIGVLALEVLGAINAS